MSEINNEIETCPICGMELEYVRGEALPATCPNGHLHEEKEEKW